MSIIYYIIKYTLHLLPIYKLKWHTFIFINFDYYKEIIKTFDIIFIQLILFISLKILCLLIH